MEKLTAEQFSLKRKNMETLLLWCGRKHNFAMDTFFSRLNESTRMDGLVKKSRMQTVFSYASTSRRMLLNCGMAQIKAYRYSKQSGIARHRLLLGRKCATGADRNTHTGFKQFLNFALTIQAHEDRLACDYRMSQIRDAAENDALGLETRQAAIKQRTGARCLQAVYRGWFSKTMGRRFTLWKVRF